MRPLLRYALPCFWIGTAHAQSPPPDSSARFFAGEWTGSGEQGAYCYVMLDVNGTGRVLVDAGSGDWSGARIQWRYRQQSLFVTSVTPMTMSVRLRLMPLRGLTLASQFNAGLLLRTAPQTPPCQLQRLDAAARQLRRARAVIEATPPADAPR